MHLVLPSNACEAIYPNNNSAHFKINLPETLHFPNHEIGLQRVYYCKEFATIPKVPIQVNVIQPEFSKLVWFDLPGGISTPEEFATVFLAKAKYDSEKVEISIENKKQVRIANRTACDLTLKFPPELSTEQAIRINQGSSFSFEAAGGAAAFAGEISARPTNGICPEVVILQRGYFQTGLEVVKELDKAMCTAVSKHKPSSQIAGSFLFNSATNRCHYSMPPKNVLSVDLKTAAHIFGFSTPELSTAKEAEEPIDFTQGIQTMYIYSSIVEPVIVGDVKVPLLGAIPFNRKLQGEQEYYEFTNPSYLPLVKHPFDTIEMQLCDDMGISLKSVLRGKTVLCAHIRECKR